jgi:DNA-binding NarL/FixJ family response regulator
VLDIQMPGKSGIEVTRHARAQKLRCGILMVTAFDDAPYVKSALQAGANGYILKTGEPEELIAAVHEVYEGQLVLDRNLNFSLAAMHMAGPSSPTSRMMGRDVLTPREVEVLQRIARGLTNKAIAAELEISDRTVQGHIANIFEKLGAESRTDAVMIALRAGWIANA